MSTPSPRASSPELSPAPSAASSALPPLVNAAFLRVLIAQLSIGFGFSIYFLLPKYLATELGAEPSTVGMVTAAGLAAAVIASPLMGAALDRFGRQRPMLAGGLAIALTSLGMLTVTSVGPWLYFLRVVQGMGFALAFNAAAVIVTDLSPPERIGQAMGLLGVASLVTNAVAPALGEGVALAWGWSPVFLLAAAMGVAVMAFSFSLPSVPQRSAANAPLAPPSAAGVWYAAGIAGAAFGTLITFAQGYALELGAERVAGYFIGYTLGALIVRVGFGGSVDRMGRRRVAQFALATYGVVLLATADLRPSLLGLFGFGFGVAHGFTYPALAALVAEGSSAAKRGRAIATFNAAFNAGCGIAMLGCGWLARVQGYRFVFALVGVITLVSVTALAAPTRRVARSLAPPDSHP
jgi:MFS family permease